MAEQSITEQRFTLPKLMFQLLPRHQAGITRIQNRQALQAKRSITGMSTRTFGEEEACDDQFFTTRTSEENVSTTLEYAPKRGRRHSVRSQQAVG